MNDSPASSTARSTPTYSPPEIKHVGPKTFKGELEMYDWLLDKIVHQCATVGVSDTERVVHVMTQIFEEEPKKTEEVMQALELDDDDEFDVTAFLACFTDQDTLRHRFGDEIYANLLSTLRENSSTSSSHLTVCSSEYSSTPSRSPSPTLTSFTTRRGAQRASALTTPSSTPRQSISTLTRTTSSYSRVRSALKLKWSALKRTDTSSGPRTAAPPLAHYAFATNRRTEEGEEDRRRSFSGATRVSLTMPSESSLGTLTFSEDSLDVKIRTLRSSLRQSPFRSILSPEKKKRKRPSSSVTFATPIIISHSSSSVLQVSGSASRVQSGKGEGLDRKESEEEEGKEKEEEEGEEKVVEEEEREGEKRRDLKKKKRQKESDSLLELSDSAGRFVRQLLEEGAEVMPDYEILRQVMLESWFPAEHRRGEDCAETIDNVFRGLREC